MAGKWRADAGKWQASGRQMRVDGGQTNNAVDWQVAGSVVFGVAGMPAMLDGGQGGVWHGAAQSVYRRPTRQPPAPCR